MRQEALVITGGQTARVLVMRVSACTGDCKDCGGCAEQKPIYAEAANPLGAVPGSYVTLETETGAVLASALLVYFLPLVLFFTVYFLAQGLGAGSGLSAVMSAIGFAASFLIAKRYDRARAKSPVCTIVDIRESGNQE